MWNGDHEWQCTTDAAKEAQSRKHGKEGERLPYHFYLNAFGPVSYITERQAFLIVTRAVFSNI